MVELKGFGEEEEKKGLFGPVQKGRQQDLETMKAQYGKVEANVDKIAQEPGAAPDHAAEGRGHV